MKNTTALKLVIFVLLFSGAYLWYSRVYAPTKRSQISNQRMLQEANTTPIVTQSNIEYFPGASGYFARPEAEGSYPGVVMIHENRGLRPEIKATADDLAKEGYLVLAVDLFGGKVLETQDEARAMTSTLKQETSTQNLKAAVSYLKEKGAVKIASLGWCFGGGQSLQLALSGVQLDATIIYYGRLVTTPKELSAITWPVLGIFGEKDTAITPASVDLFDKALDSAGITNEIYIYPGVGHAFANPSGMNYAPKETRDAWEKTTAFLKKYLK